MHSIRWLTPDHRWRLAAGMSLWLISAAQAAVTLDGSLGRAGALPGPNYQITADWGQQHGGNLFHSFGVFSINTGESATFSGPGSVRNIIGRVTGGQVSFIDGAIRSTIPGANLYLLNPAGVLFGEHAALDVPGSVHISTADYLRLSDGGRFDARTPGNSVLTVAPVAAFGFLSDAPGKIEVNGGFLRVPESQTLSLIGGDITLTNATLYAPAGRINLAAVGSAGEVIPSDTDLAMQGFGTLGTLTLTHTGDPRQWNDVVIGDVDTSGEGGGAIFIRGGQFIAQGRSLTQSNTTGDQNGRGINIDVDRLTLSGGSRIQSNILGNGRGGDIKIVAREEVMIDGAYFDTEAKRLRPSGLIANAFSDSGQAGTITLSTTRLSLTRGGAITSVGLNNSRSGDLNITATESVTIDAINPDFIGNVDIVGLSTAAENFAGNIHLSTARLTLSGGGSMSTFTWGDGAGRGGDIHITASEMMTVAGPQSAVFADAYGSGSTNAGNITIATGRLSLTGGGIISSGTYGLGHGGDIHITASDSITIVGEGYDAPSGIHFFSGVFTNSCNDCAAGDAGNITLTTRNLFIDAVNGGDSSGSAGIGARSDHSSGGNITVNADHITLLNGAEISSSVAGSEPNDNGGNVTLNSTNVVALNGSHITAKATQGKGGNILVNADVFLHDAADITDVLNASSQVEGNDGTVQNNAPTPDISGSLTVLPANYLDAAGQLSRRCGASNPESRSRFTVQGRGGLPAAPDGALPAPGGRCQPPPAAPSAATRLPAANSLSVTIASSSDFGDR